MHRKTKLVFLALVLGMLLSVLVAFCVSFKPALVPYESFPDSQQTEVIGGHGFTVVVGNATYYFDRNGKLTAFFGPIVKL